MKDSTNSKKMSCVVESRWMLKVGVFDPISSCLNYGCGIAEFVTDFTLSNFRASSPIENGSVSCKVAILEFSSPNWAFRYLRCYN